MIRGTTPTITFAFPIETDKLSRLWITFYQLGQEIFTLEKDECKLSEREVEVTLTQSQTLRFRSDDYVEIQIRALLEDGTAVASDIFTEPAERILKDGEI